jgi:hypothetical protein
VTEQLKGPSLTATKDGDAPKLDPKMVISVLPALGPLLGFTVDTDGAK